MTTLFRPTALLLFEPRGCPEMGCVRAVARIHPMDCSCARCAPIGVESPNDLSAQTKAKLAIAAAVVGSAIAFAIDPVGAIEALRTTVAL